MTTTTTPSLPLTSGTWQLDPLHSTVEFSVRHMGISRVRGRFSGLSAEVVIGDSLATTSLAADVDLSTVDTGNADRDAHLRNADFFDVDRHPTMSFRSTGVRAHGDDVYVVTGDLTLNGVTRPQDLTVEFNGTSVFPGDGVTHAGFTATGSLSRKAFGVSFNVPMAAGGFVVGDKVDIEIDVQLLPAG